MSRNSLYARRHPLLPLKNVVIFPRNIVTLLVGRPRSIQAVEEALANDRRIIVTTHQINDVDDPAPDDLFSVGALAEVVSIDRQHGNAIQVVLEGITRVRISQFDVGTGFYSVTADELREISPDPVQAQALIQHVQGLTTRYADTRGSLASEVVEMVHRATDAGHLADLLATQLMAETAVRQELLETIDPLRRLEQVAVHMTSELDVADIEQRIRDRVRDQIEKHQRELYLREQLKAIHDELSGEDGNEIEAMRRKIAARGLPENVEKKLNQELMRLERMPSVSAESTVVRTYLDTMLSLPWREQSEDSLDLAAAQQILDADHFGLDAVKERILDYLAVRSLRQAVQDRPTNSQILCFVGPPGVGKTSLCRSIADSMGRRFVRVSLGGVRDEAEIRGHRRTYIGAMPGRMISAIKQAETINPLILLDEIDKLSSDFRGDPGAALLEVLDPEQNHAFTDHFLDVPYDLSQVLFITTANYLQQIPRPLRDRMEIIEVAGYTEDEKMQIGQHHLLSRQLLAHGLSTDSVEISPDIWQLIVRSYTREAGVRELDREIATICRKTAREIVQSGAHGVVITPEMVEQFLGPRRYGFDRDVGSSQIGVAIGLGTTEIGGELIPVEVASMPGSGNLTITGQAGDVMQESARAAMSYARTRARHLNIDAEFQTKLDVHIHLPEGATPKDGPSAGITMATALISALTQRPVRADTAMTGEITLRGRVLAIGGLKDKALAAHRHGIRRLIVPAENRPDLGRIPQNVQEDIEFIFASTMDEVIAAALIGESDLSSMIDTSMFSDPMNHMAADA